MPRPHWKTASETVQRTIRGWMTDDKQPAEAWLDAASIAKSFGYDFDPPSTPRLAELEKLTAARELAKAAEFRRAHALALGAERSALGWWSSTRAWAATNPSKLTKAHVEEQKRATTDLERRVQERARELLTLANGVDGARMALRPADALDQARRELGQVSV